MSKQTILDAARRLDLSTWRSNFEGVPHGAHRIFHQLPLLVRLAVAITLLNTWILIAEFVIDRYGLD